MTSRSLANSVLAVALLGGALACGDTTENPAPEPKPNDIGVPRQLEPEAWLVWASNRAARPDGRHEIYLQNANGGGITRLTNDSGRTPAWSPDGRWISYVHAPDYTAHVMRWDGSEDKVVCQDVTITNSPSVFWLHDNSGIVCATSAIPAIPGRDVTFIRVDPDTGVETPLFAQADFDHIADIRFEPAGMTSDGAWLLGWAYGLFDGGFTAENGTFDTYHSTVMLDPTEPSKVYFLGSGCLAATSPVNDWIYHVSRESPTSPDIFRMHAADVMDRDSYELEVGFEDANFGHEYMPRISNDGLWMVYGASSSCHNWYTCDYEIFLHEIGRPADERVRLTQDPANDNFPDLHIGSLWQAP